MSESLMLNPDLGADSTFARKGGEPLQRNLLLAFLPYLGTPLKGSSVEKETRKRVAEALGFLKGALGPWKLAWGPGIYQAAVGSVAANTMFVVENQDTGELFISIAGTNPFSAYAWIDEDMAISKTVRWQYGDAPAEAALSMATQNGLLALQGIVPHSGQGKNMSLQAFLERRFAREGDAVEITVSGHSLGGALSPAVGLWLLDTAKNWDIHSRASISVCAFAGPTPGNEEFATYISERLGDRLNRVANPYDAAVHAWNIGDIAKMKALYTPDIPRDTLFDRAGDAAISATHGIRYQQPGFNPTILDGRINTHLISPMLPSFINMITQVLYQHTIAYFKLIGVPPLQSEESLFHHVVRELDHVVNTTLTSFGVPWILGLPIRAGARIAAEAFALLPKSWTR